MKILRTTPIFALFAIYPIMALGLILLFSTWLGSVLAGWGGGLGEAGAHFFSSAFIFFSILYLTWRHDEKLMFHHMFRVLSFNDDLIHRDSPEYSQRMRDFADRVAAVLATNDADEVVIVGHSNGSIFACAMVAEFLRRKKGELDSRLSVVTLGSQFNLGFIPGASRIRQDILDLANNPELVWVDVFAPQDIINAGKFDPVTELGLSPKKLFGPHLVSARLKAAMLPEHYRRIRYSFYELHLQFLKANQTGKGFDYYQVIGGSSRIQEYFGLSR